MDIETGSAHRLYKSDPHAAPHAACYSRKTEAIILPQDKACTFQFSPTMQQAVQRSFTTERLSSVCVSPCGNILVGGGGETGCLFAWNIITGELLRMVKAHLRKITCISFSSDGSQMATASEDSTCKVWALGPLLSATNSNVTAETIFTAHTVAVMSCAFLNFSDVVATASLDRSVKLFRSRGGAQLMTVTVDVPLNIICVSPDDLHIVVGGQGGHLFFISLSEANDIQRRNDRNRVLTAESAAPVGYPITRDDSWMPELRKRPPVAGGHSKNIVSLAFLPLPRHHEILVASENGTILVWDVMNLRVVQEIATVKKGICHIVSIPHLTPESTAALKYDRCVSLSKYPVDPHGQTGYVIPNIPAEDAQTGNHANKIDLHNLPNVKYNKAKQKRLREEIARNEAEEAERRKAAVEKQRLFEEEMIRLNQQSSELQEMARKLTEKIAAVEKRQAERRV